MKMAQEAEKLLKKTNETGRWYVLFGMVGMQIKARASVTEAFL